MKIPVTYDGEALDTHFRLDFLVDDRAVVEVKAVEQLARVHEAQLLTYLRSGEFPIGLLLNFNVVLMKQGIVRRILSRSVFLGVLRASVVCSGALPRADARERTRR